MSVNSWDGCPTELLLQIFSKLEATSLLICMRVSSKWKEVAYYILKYRHGGLEKVFSNRLEDGGVIYRRKSNINFRHSYLNSLLWYNICDAQIHFAGLVTHAAIRHISIYKDNVIIVNNDGITYFDVDNLNIRGHFDFDCESFEESDYMVVMQKPIVDTENTTLIMYAKKSNTDFTFTNNAVFDIVVRHYRFHEDRCFIIKDVGQISVIIWDENYSTFREKFLGRYYGPVSNVAAIHATFYNDLYIILRTGDILRCDTNSIVPLVTRLHCDLSNVIIRFPVTTFYRFGAVFKTPTNSKFDVKYYDEIDFMLIQCPGLTCVTDHGNVLFLGYDNGEVKIFIKSKLIKGNHVSERTIKVEEYYSRASPCEIRLIDVHEAISSHVLFIYTNFVTVKLSIYNLDLLKCIKDVEDNDQIYLSIIPILNIEE